jgi:carbonic anhydrase
MHTLLVPDEIDLESHYLAGTCAIGCLDRRVRSLFNTLVQELEKRGGYDNTDIVIFAGGAWNLAEAGSVSQKALLEQIVLSMKLHETSTVTATTHENCGAAGEEAQCGGDRRKQFLIHVERHRRINATIRKQFEGTIRNFYLSKNGVIEIDLALEELSDGLAERLALVG